MIALGIDMANHSFEPNATVRCNLTAAVKFRILVGIILSLLLYYFW